MRARLILLLCLWVLPVRGAELSREVPLREGSVRLRVRHDAGHERWAAYQLERAAAFLPAVEAYLDVPLHQAARGYFPEQRGTRAWPVLLVGQERVLLGGRWIGAYNNSAGRFPGERGIFLEYWLSPEGDPAAVLHELGHFWLYDSAGVTHADAGGGASWFNEGATSFLPLALLEARLLRLAPAEASAVGAHWGVAAVPLRVDAPIEADLRPRGGELLLLFYQKSFLVQALLRRELGPPRYRALLQGAARRITELRSGEAVLRHLSAQRAAPWRTLLGGWVFPGAYGPTAPQRFAGAQVTADGAVRLR